MWIYLADSRATSGYIALLSTQAEHDTEARPILVTTSSTVVNDVNACLQKRLAVLPTRDTAKEAVKKGFAVVCKVNVRCHAPSDVGVCVTRRRAAYAHVGR